MSNAGRRTPGAFENMTLQEPAGQLVKGWRVGGARRGRWVGTRWRGSRDTQGA